MLNQGITPANNSLDTSSSSSSSSSSRPAIGFPVITVLLISGIIILVGFLYCCCRWNKIRFLRRSSLDVAYLEEVITVDLSHFQGTVEYPDDLKLQRQNESITVSMPGDEIPKFIAFPCPLEPPREIELKKKIMVDRHSNTSNTSTHSTMVTIAHS